MECQLKFVTDLTGAMGDGPRLSITLGSKAQRGGENLRRIIGEEPLR